MGSKGAVYATAATPDPVHVPCEKVASVVDTTGAGDAFVGAVQPALTRAQIDGFRVVDLKKELAARGLKTSGLKAVLKARLLEALGLPAS